MSRYDQYIRSIVEDMRKDYPNTTEGYVRDSLSLIEEGIRRGIDWADKNPISPNPVEMTQQEKKEAMSILTALFNTIKHDITFHSFCDGFNEAMRVLMQIGGQLELDTRVSPFNFISIENKQEV